MKLKKETAKRQELIKEFNKQLKSLKEQKSELYSGDQERKQNFAIKTWLDFAQNSSIHAIHYVTSESVNAVGKLFWLCVIFTASLAMVYCCMLLSERFRSNLTATVFESTMYRVTEIPFPSITLCNNNLLNYTKTNEAIEKFIPNSTQSQKDLFVKYIHLLQNMEYGSFDEFAPMNDIYDGSLEMINTTAIVRFMVPKCEDFLIECKWRGKAINCCDIFSRQYSEYGLCYSFNSFSNEGTAYVNRSDHFPWRIAVHGKNTALSVLLNLHIETKVESDTGNDKLGAFAIVQHPHEHPSTAHFISVDSIIALVIKPTVFTASSDVSRLRPADRQCYFDVS